MPTFSFPIGSVLRTVTWCTAPGQVATNTHKWQMTSLTGASVFNTLDFTSTYDTQLAALYFPLLSNDANYYGTQVYLANPIGAAPRPDTSNANFAAGTGGAGLMPTQVSPIIAFYTNLLGKQGQGRTYLPFPPPASLQTNGTPAPAYTLLLGALSNFLTTPLVIAAGGGVTATFTPVLYQGGPAAALPILSAAVRDAFATQRRRGAFGRANPSPNF